MRPPGPGSQRGKEPRPPGKAPKNTVAVTLMKAVENSRTQEAQGAGLQRAALLTKSHRGHTDGCGSAQHFLANCFTDTEL